MTRLSTLAFALILAPALLATSTAAEPLPLEDRMTHSEFTAAGLHRLSQDELAALNAFLAREASQRPAQPRSDTAREQPAQDTRPQAQPAPRVESDVGFEQRRKREAFQARIQGDFQGWSGDTRFELENGQVWETNQSRTFHYAGPSEPVVTIEPGMLGSWYLSVEGYNARVRVRRVE